MWQKVCKKTLISIFICIFATSNLSLRAKGRQRHIGKATLYALFLAAWTTTIKDRSKTIAEVTPTDVYIRSRSVPRAYYALTHTFGCIVYIPSEGIKSARSIKEAFSGPKQTERAAGDTLVLFCFVGTWNCKKPLTLGYQSDHLLLTEYQWVLSFSIISTHR